ncbi:MAG: putative cytosol aminopeptidase [Chlamydiae bacterium]|nr:putative cytosol aminopeptidase [Chlamydiota bacterium]
MMKTKCILKHTQRDVADALVLPFYRTAKSRPVAACSIKSLVKWAQEPIKHGDFGAAGGEVFITYPTRQKEKRMILLGLGDQKKISTEILRRVYAKLAQYCHLHKIKKINLITPELSKVSEENIAQGISEGLFLSNYVFEHLKSAASKKTVLLTQCSFIGLDTQKNKLIRKWKTLSEGVNLARDLVNGNADDVNAEALSAAAHKLGKQFKKIKTVVLDKESLEKENLNLILTVNRGAHIDPALIVLNYQGGSKSEKPTAILGKGISYDTGGIQLKPRSGRIKNMKSDMSGAAAVLGILYAAAKLDLPLNIVGLIPACENSISSESYKPGDVYESYLGKTVEIISTDAEGRLLLADALAYAKNTFNPKRMIDLATLTGGVIAALGDRFTGVMGNNPHLVNQLKHAGEKSGEKVWELPLHEDYKEALKSNIADLRNSFVGPGYPSAIVAGLFLQEFVQSTPWAHLDIAGTAYLSKPQQYHKTKATGVGVRLVIAFLEELLES